MPEFKCVILGGGMVAGYAAKEMAERGLGRGELAIVSSDSAPPYERPPLSKGFLLGNDEEASVYINAPEFYRAHGIDLLLGSMVERIDTGARKVHLTTGATLGYERLLYATGARVRDLKIPGRDLEGVSYLRSLDDSKRIRRAYEDAKQAVVLGSGFIGMEVASVLAQRGVKTTMVFPDERVWQRFFTPEMSAFFEQYYQQRGVAFLRGASAERVEGDGRVSAVVASDRKRLACDVIVAGIGVVPNDELARDAGIRVDNGVVVNEYLETSADGVLAAGDVANYRDVLFDKQRRIEHWDNAVEQGKHAARTLMGERAAFGHVPYFFSDLFDLSYEFWGDTEGADDVVHRGDVTTESFSAWWLRGGTLVAAFVMNRPGAERDAAPKWIEERREVPRELLRDASREIEVKAA